MLLACLSAILPQSSEAAKREAVHRLNYFQSYETEVDGRQALRIEIGMDRDNVTYDVTAHPYLQKQLVIDLSNTEPGELKSDYKFSSKLAKALHIRELEARHTQVRIDCKNPVIDGSYAVHAEPADRKAKKLTASSSTFSHRAARRTARASQVSAATPSSSTRATAAAIRVPSARRA